MSLATALLAMLGICALIAIVELLSDAQVPLARQEGGLTMQHVTTTDSHIR